jgi:hypothetical protein
VIMQIFKRTASVTPRRHGAGGAPPGSVRRPFRLEKPFMPSLQRIPVEPAVLASDGAATSTMSYTGKVSPDPFGK